MKMLVYVISIAMILSNTMPYLRGDSRPEQKEILFHKELSSGDQIVITRQQLGQSDTLSKLLRTTPTPSVATAFIINVELQSPKITPILLASTIQWDYEKPFAGFCILDVNTEGGQVLISAAVGTRLGVWRVSMDQLIIEEWTWLQHWEVAALTSQLQATSVHIKTKRLEDGRWSINVTDMRTSEKMPPTVFEQDGREWRFIIKQRWNGKP